MDKKTREELLASLPEDPVNSDRPTESLQQKADRLALDAQPCEGFPDDCPNRRTVEPTLAHGGGIRCGCSDATLPNGVISADALKDVSITASNIQANLISIPVNGKSFITIHPDGELEFGDDYTPDAAAQAFWDAVQRFAPSPMLREYGSPLTARINAELDAGQRAQKQVEDLTEAVVLWRDRPGEGVGLAIALADILDTDKPEPPAATALVRVLKECDRIERAVSDNPTSPDFDGAYLACLRRIRQAAGVLPADEDDLHGG